MRRATTTIIAVAALAVVAGCASQPPAGPGDAAVTGMPLEQCHAKFDGLIEIIGEDGVTEYTSELLRPTFVAFYADAKSLAQTNDRAECSEQWPRYDAAYPRLWTEESLIGRYDIPGQLKEREQDLEHDREAYGQLRLPPAVRHAFQHLRAHADDAGAVVRDELEAMAATDPLDSEAVRAAIAAVKDEADNSQLVKSCLRDISVIETKGELNEE